MANHSVVETSLADTRLYRYIELSNGLKAILISSLKSDDSISVDGVSESDSTDADGDELADASKETEDKKSAAALCIRVGSFSDPKEAQGLSHFLEHMVFMGSEKYPTENDFDAYLSRRGGESNAYTENEVTVFHFNVHHRHFEKSLDRFAQFFVSPLLLKDSVDRELNAVHSEFELANSKDSHRLRFLISSLAHGDSPYRIFGYGNQTSLRVLPEKLGTNVYELLMRHRETTYSSDRMTLAIQSRDSLDDLEAMVRNIFSHIPNSKSPIPDFSRFAGSFDTASFRKFYRVCPLGDRKKLRVAWSLPALITHYESTPLGIICSLVGHEGTGSVLAHLQQKNLATSLACGASLTAGFEMSSFCTLFIVYISLTDKGCDEVHEVCRALFDYLKVLRESFSVSETLPSGPETKPCHHDRVVHTFPSFVDEYQRLRQIGFAYSEPSEPEDTVVHVAHMLQLVAPEHVYSGGALLKKVDFELYKKLLAMLTPERAAIFFMSSRFSSSAKDKSDWDVEPWFTTSYSCEDVNPIRMNSWIQSKPAGDLHLPFKNKFIPSCFDLLPASEDMKFPVNLNAVGCGSERRDYGALWFQQSTKFKIPKASVMVHFWSPLPSQSKEKHCLHMLMCYGLNQTLTTIAYEGSEADLHYELSSAESGLQLHMTGFNEKLFCFYQTILDHIASEFSYWPVPHFDSYQEAIRQMIYNSALKPDTLNSQLQAYLLRNDAFLFDELLSCLKELSEADLVNYKQQFFSRLRLTVYAHGNLKPKDAIEFFEYTTRKISFIPFGERKFADAAVLTPGSYRIRLKNCNPTDINMCIAQVHLLGYSDLKKSTYNELLAYLLSEPAFNYLRTKETLSYRVCLRSWNSFPGGNRHAGVSLMACSQATKYSASYVSGRLSAFWYRIAPKILAATSPSDFATAVSSLIALKQLEDPNMITEFSRNWAEILLGESMFDRREASIEILKTINKKDLWNFFHQHYLSPESRKSLIVQVDASPDKKVGCQTQSPSYVVTIEHVELDDQMKIEEQRAIDEVDVPAAVSACDYEVPAADEFLGGIGVDPQHNYIKADNRVYLPDARTFRSVLQFERGRSTC